ncbi:hypothetical protein Cch01nite_13520 [Cellulomonas chitinilytica]|uniref:Uncharacterized protein n=1 Tax=Cellulomonas chitinilytica TaxID=398759 RepID=A0A919NZP4_9CELL|nr:DUF5980 family protein [Cellulomonas chitinilytica]GIG20628.1 hypothetical protein Cch01nite_13520 [Cellulomonas chitinilytica]
MDRRRIVWTLILSALLLGLVGTTPASAAGTWQLIDNHQRTCVVSTRGGTSYFGIWVKGTWTHQIDVGASALPAGASTSTFYAPVPPGSSDGVGSLAYVAVAVPAGTAVGTYTASLWASDARSTDRVPITLVVNATSCRRY